MDGITISGHEFEQAREIAKDREAWQCYPVHGVARVVSNSNMYKKTENEMYTHPVLNFRQGDKKGFSTGEGQL